VRRTVWPGRTTTDHGVRTEPQPVSSVTRLDRKPEVGELTGVGRG